MMKRKFKFSRGTLNYTLTPMAGICVVPCNESAGLPVFRGFFVVFAFWRKGFSFKFGFEYTIKDAQVFRTKTP